MKNKMNITLLALGTLSLTIGCKPETRALKDDGGSNISASVASIDTKPEQLGKTLSFDLICNDVKYPGKLEGTNLKFANTAAVKKGEKCTVEAWGEKVEKYEYFGKSEGNTALYIFFSKSEVTEDRKLSLYSSKLYREKAVDSSSEVSMFLGKFGTEVEGFAAHIKCGGDAVKNEIPSKVEDGYIEFKVNKELFVDQDSISCSKLVLDDQGGGNVYENLETKITLSKSGIVKADSKPMDIKKRSDVVETAGELDVSLNEKALDGEYTAACENSDGAVVSSEHKLSIKTDDSGVRTLVHGEVTYSEDDCQGEGVTVNKTYEMMVTGNGDEEGSLEITLMFNDEIDGYTKMLISGDTLKTAKVSSVSERFISNSKDGVKSIEGGMTFKK